MTEFEKQIAARIQAHEFLLLAIMRGALAHQTPAEAAAQLRQLERQFATVTVPPDADPETDLDEVMRMHQDAQSFLSRILAQANPHQNPGAEAR